MRDIQDVLSYGMNDWPEQDENHGNSDDSGYYLANDEAPSLVPWFLLCLFPGFRGLFWFNRRVTTHTRSMSYKAYIRTLQTFKREYTW